MKDKGLDFLKNRKKRRGKKRRKIGESPVKSRIHRIA
jgi:hypothetical protein